MHGCSSLAELYRARARFRQPARKRPWLNRGITPDLREISPSGTSDSREHPPATWLAVASGNVAVDVGVSGILYKRARTTIWILQSFSESLSHVHTARLNQKRGNYTGEGPKPDFHWSDEVTRRLASWRNCGKTHGNIHLDRNKTAGKVYKTRPCAPVQETEKTRFFWVSHKAKREKKAHPYLSW